MTDDALCRCGHGEDEHGKLNGCTHLNYGSGCEVHVCSCNAFAARVPVNDEPEPAWQAFRSKNYIDPSIDTPALRSAFKAGRRETLSDVTTKAKHLADEWESHPDGDIQMFVAQLLAGFRAARQGGNSDDR